MTVFPASGAAGKSGKALTGTVTTTMSPTAAASPLVAADARGPSSTTLSASVSGPRELLSNHLLPGLDGEPREGTADLSASDESHSCHILSVLRKLLSFGGCDSGPCHQLAGK
jgi:hypothetical protein